MRPAGCRVGTGDLRRGAIPVTGRIGSTEFTTSLFPKDGGYLLPLKDAVRKPEGIAEADTVTVHLTVGQ